MYIFNLWQHLVNFIYCLRVGFLWSPLRGLASSLLRCLVISDQILKLLNGCRFGTIKPSLHLTLILTNKHLWGNLFSLFDYFLNFFFNINSFLIRCVMWKGRRMSSAKGGFQLGSIASKKILAACCTTYLSCCLTGVFCNVIQVTINILTLPTCLAKFFLRCCCAVM